MRTGCSLLAHWDPDTDDNSHDANLRKAERLLAQLPVIMAARHRLTGGDEPVKPDPTLSLAGNMLWMLRGEKPRERWTKAMDVSLILYAEHEYNASTFAARVITSTRADLHSAITGAIGALKGPLHGGANERVLEVLQEVGSADKAEAVGAQGPGRQATDHGLRPPRVQNGRPARQVSQDAVPGIGRRDGTTRTWSRWPRRSSGS